MVDRREELTGREAEVWAEFDRLVTSIDRDLRDEPALADGWSVRDLLWHVAYWWGDLAALLDRIREGTYEEPEWTTDETNAEVLAASRSMTLDEVEEGLARARARMLSAWTALPQVGDDAAELFSSETIEHYEEHLAVVRSYAAAGRPS